MKAFKHVIPVCSLFILIIIVSCSKPVGDNPSNQQIIADWKWVRTDGGIANNIHDTPASTGKNVVLKITGDYRYAVYTNGILTSQGTYTLESQNCIHDHANKALINFSSPADQDMMIEKNDNSSLELSDNVYDGIISVFSKN